MDKKVPFYASTNDGDVGTDAEYLVGLDEALKRLEAFKREDPNAYSGDFGIAFLGFLRPEQPTFHILHWDKEHHRIDVASEGFVLQFQVAMTHEEELIKDCLDEVPAVDILEKYAIRANTIKEFDDIPSLDAKIVYIVDQEKRGLATLNAHLMDMDLAREALKNGMQQNNLLLVRASSLGAVGRIEDLAVAEWEEFNEYSIEED